MDHDCYVLKLLAFTADTFYQLAERSVSFTSLETTNSPSELITVLEPSLRKRPIAYPRKRCLETSTFYEVVLLVMNVFVT